MSSGQEDTCDTKLPRRVYIVTLSSAHRKAEQFPTKASFGRCVKEHFNKGPGKVKVNHWACTQEPHLAGGYHYHVAVKLSNPKRWLCVKRSLEKEEKIEVNFSDKHDCYVDAYRYITKKGAVAALSIRHPHLDAIASPPSKRGTVANRKRSAEKRATSSSSQSRSTIPNSDDGSGDEEEPQAVQGPSTSSNNRTSSKVRRLTALDVSEFIVKHNIRREKELLHAAHQRKKEGERDLAAYIFNRPSRQLLELIANTWRMEEAAEDLERETKTRMELLRTERACTPGCNGLWYRLATQVLQWNNITHREFSGAVRHLLARGRGKYRNILLVGPKNCAKTFLVKPLEEIFKCFQNPSNNRYGWVGADQAECILLQDFRWSQELIAWHDMLLLLEGETVKLPSPKNQFAEDVCINTNVPIFATSKRKIEYVGKFNTRDDRETEMMDVRWRLFTLHYEIPEKDRVEVPPCAACFSRLVLAFEDDDAY